MLPQLSIFQPGPEALDDCGQVRTPRACDDAAVEAARARMRELGVGDTGEQLVGKEPPPGRGGAGGPGGEEL
jgi:hypothetical protein